MNSDTISTIGKYLIAAIATVGDFILLYTGKEASLGVALLVIGWIIRDSAGNSATSNAVKTIAASQPTGTVIGTAAPVPPPTTGA